MKKLLSFLGISTIVTASAMTIVSCGFKGDRYSGIYVVTDTGKIADRSFNQSGYVSGNRFVKDALLIENAEVGYIQPTVMTDAPWMYSQSYKNGAKALVLPGFKHLNYLESADQSSELAGGAAIIVDASAGKGNDGFFENTIGLLYRADMSGFWAGLAGIMHVFKVTNDVPKLATYGGMQNGTAGDPFMAGFLASVKVFNDSYEAYLKNPVTRTSQENNQALGIAKIAESFLGEKFVDKIGDRRAEIVEAQREGYNGKGTGHAQWFTDSYDAGKGADISQMLINAQGANVIMPVAGPQTADTLNILAENKYQNKRFVIGVDTNQVEMYDTFSDFFITSAEKDIVGSTALALAHSGSFSDEMEDAKVKIESGSEGKDYNDVLHEMGNSLSVTTKIDGKFEKVYTGLVEDDKDETEIQVDGNTLIAFNNWKEKDLWLGGSISTGGENKVELGHFEDIKSVFSSATELASLEYFEYVTTPGQSIAKYTLSIEAINQYADTILGNMSSGGTETNYGDFINYGK
ncbi:hypothetical protein [Spiroplasma sp. TIUS-1]|uniref:hypothetical protein n=1 Tax=Spiroplasma sp. TIUS-1 TaxID=216963 RepID=UPI0013A6A08B|nr:hypothetical protein [Spiroplasma sp. TIUS-1]